MTNGSIAGSVRIALAGALALLPVASFLAGCGKSDDPTEAAIEKAFADESGGGRGAKTADGERGRTRARAEPRSIAPESIALLKRAVGLMGRFEFEEAAKVFAGVAGAPDAPPEARLGLAIATLNQSREGAQDEALVMLAEVLAAASKPGSGELGAELAVRANYCSGLCQLFLGRADLAAVSFRRAVDARGNDAYANYFLAQSLEQIGDAAGALPFYERAAERDPYLKSAFLGVQRCARRAGDERRAETALAAFEKLAANPRGRAAEFKYTRMGPLGLAIAPDAGARDDAPREGPIFGEWRELAIAWPDGYAPPWATDSEQHAVVGDIDGDGRLDLLLARALVARGDSGSLESRTLVLLGADGGSFRAEPDHLLAVLAGGGVNSLLLGDIDSDGRVDAYVCRSGGNRLLLATAEGGFRDATEAARAAGPGRSCVDGALADLDHDGDLDLFLAFADAPNELLVNNLDGT
ncbi:MAG: tetratricopeptide repeat protein, partial [Planctomycetota bacterium]